MNRLASTIALFTLGLGCASSPPPAPASAAAPGSTTAPASAAAPASGSTPTLASATDTKGAPAAAAAKPDAAKAKEHLKSHVKYPATRAQLLAACADTPEFTAQEKKWFADNVPEGTYKSSDEVIKALKY